jgi:hypothetical protein
MREAGLTQCDPNRPYITHCSREPQVWSRLRSLTSSAEPGLWVTEMLFPLMGLLFTLFLGGVAAGLLCLLIPRLRQWAPFVAFPSVLAALLAFCLSWGLALGLEKSLHSEPLAAIGFFGGFLLGGVGGVHVGLLFAVRLRRFIITKY